MQSETLTFTEFKNSAGYKLLCILSLPSSLLTVSALYKVIIGVSSQNLLMAIELIVSQSQFFGIRIALSFSISPENMLGKIWDIRVSGVFGICDGMRGLSGILIVLVFIILSKLTLNTNIVLLWHCKNRSRRLRAVRCFKLLRRSVTGTVAPLCSNSRYSQVMKSAFVWRHKSRCEDGLTASPHEKKETTE